MTFNPQIFNPQNINYKMILSISSDLKEKETTFNFKKIEIKSLNELMEIMNNYAISNGLFLNGHRHSRNIKAMGNILFIDIDNEPNLNQKPYYLDIEYKLKRLNISFVSVPSKNADKYTYKRHIAIILNNNLPLIKKEYLRAVYEIINKIGIDLNKIDIKVQENQISFLAPCTINKNFKNYKKESYFYNGVPLQIRKNKEQRQEENNIYTKNFINPNTLISFSDGSILSTQQAKILILPRTKKECYCPIHNDKKPSATFYHNSDNTINIFCSVCGNIEVEKKILFNEPKVNHLNFNYSISIVFKNKEMENTLKTVLGINYQKVNKYLIWSYKINSINDIYFLMLVKIQLINDMYSLTNLYIDNKGIFADNQTMRNYAKNTKPFSCFINKDIKITPLALHTIKIKKAIFNGYIFPELIIWETYQAFLEIDNFEIICNRGLGYFEYVLEEIEKDKKIKLQKDKKFPIRLNEKQKKESNEIREDKRKLTIIKKMTLKEEKIYKLVESGKFNKLNGVLNKKILLEKLKITKPTLDRYLKSINIKKDEIIN